MSLKEYIAKKWAARRVRQVQEMQRAPWIHQEQTLANLIHTARETAFGHDHSFDKIRTYNDFKQAVPLRNYEGLKNYIDRAYKGEKNVLWPGRPSYFAKTSGTTSGAKNIPISRQSIPNHIKGARDTLFFYLYETGNTSFLNGKMTFLSGSPVLEKNDAGIPVGRLSGIVHHYVPFYLQTNRIPSYKTNCIEDWEQKIEAILDEAISADLRLISGIPPWVQMLFERLQERTGKRVSQVWPNLSVFAHGGVDYTAYKTIFDRFF